MRLFNRLSDESRSNGNQEKKVFRGRKSDEGKRREGVAGSLSPRKLGMENLEERQLLSVNPIGNSEYDDIRAAYADLELPSSLTQINVIELTDLNAAALQNAVNQAARTTADDLILLRTTADDYVVDLESTAINVNIDSEKYGSLTIVGTGEQALTIETVDTNAFTVLNGDVKLGGAVLYNYSTNYAGQAVVESPDANVKLASSLVMIDQATTTDENGVAKTSYLVDSAMTEEDAEKYGVSNITDTSEMRVEIVDGDYNQVRHRVHATLREQYHYFGYNPSVYRAVRADRIYDASSNGAAGWVGTVANMMAYTGWAQEAGFSTAMTQPDGTVRYFESVEDAVAEYLRSGYLDTAGSFTCAQVLDYLFDGDDENCMGANLSGNTNSVEGGGLFMDIDFTKVGGYTATSDSMIDDMLRALRDGNAVTLEIITTNNRGYRSREYVSVWGYYYNPNTLDSAPNGTSNNSADYLGLICSNPTKTTVQYQVTDNHYDHPNYQDPVTRTMTHYRDENDDGSNTYNTYLLERSGSSWRFAISPYTYFNDQGAVQGARTLPEGFSYYGGYQNSQNTTYTSELVGFSWLQQYNAKMHESEITEEGTFSLESMPGNTENVIYLYFGGVGETGWDGLEHPALNLDGSAGYGVSELKMIQEVWARVAEDYAPFNVNVTTDPNVWANATNGVRCVIGGYSPSAGGLSYVGCFGPSKQDNYVYPYSLGLSAKNIAEAAAHEIGHAMGLSHDGYEHNEYYGGNGTWAPIMGTGYGATITQWSDGSYVNATNREDDVAIIASKVGYRDDDFGDTIDMAGKLDDHYVPIDINTYDPLAGTYTVNGVIENRDDYDIFSFVSHGGTYVVDVAGAGADHRFIDGDFSWDYIRHGDVENAVFAGKYYASAYDYANLNVKVELLDENGEIVLLDMDGKIQKLGYGESIVLADNYYYYVVDQFGKKVYNADGSLKEGYQAVDDSTYTTFSHFVTPELEAGKTYYISVTGVGQGNDATNGFSDYGSLGAYTLSMHESYENFYVDAEKMDVESLEYATGVDNVLNWQEAFVYSGRRLEDGSRHLGNTLTFDASLSGQTLDLRETLRFTFSRPLVDQPFSEKRFVLDATAAWDAENDRPGITIDANEKFRVMYVDNTTVELYGFTFTGGVAETTNVIYLYFGGIDGPGWSGEAHPAYDLDGDPTSFNDAELEAINEIYLRVAEDYAPFNVTVTTDQDVFNAATNAIRVVVGGTGNDRGGVAYLNSFGTQKQDCYVFPNSLGSPKSIAEAISHEVGHTLNLSHDGKDAEEYYGGTNGWAPIMGVGYYQALTQWSKGEYQGATQTQDDLAYIAARLGYKADDYSDKRANAAALRESYVRPGNFVADGLIERTGDADMFSFVATGSTYVIDVVGSGADYDRANAAGYAASLGYTNLDLRVELYDDAGNLLYTCDPTDSLFAHFEATGLIAGDSYFVRVTTTGRGNPATDGYSNYGAIGQYYVTVSAGTLADFVGEERYTSVALRNAVNEGALNATKEKGETYGKNGQTNNGGGIYNNYGWLTIGDSVIAGNRALKAGGGIYNSGGEYEDGAQHDGWLYLVNTSIVGNIVTEENSVGGGLYNESGAVATLVNVTVAGNTADYSGGGIQNAGRVNLYNTIVAENEASYGADVYTQSGKTTRAENSIIGDESRNSNYTAYKNGTNSTNVGGSSFIGTSRGSSVSSPVTTYDPKFVSYRGYDAADWSSELWKSWNLRLQGDSLAVDLGDSANLTNDLDFGQGVSNGYDRWGQDRYFFTADYQDDLAGQPRFEGDSVDAGAYEVLGKADLTEFVPSAAGSDVVNDWESSIVISRAEDDQTGSIAPFLVDENLFLNLSFINQGAAIKDSFETTVYMWKYDPKTATKQQMFADSKLGNNELALMNVKVDFADGVSMPGGDGTAVATITLTNLATGDVQTIEYDGANSFIALTNVALGSIEDIINGFVANGALEAQNEEGYYVFGYQLDSGAAIDEYSETNNFYLTSSYFDVVESPVSVNNSIVVTTIEDVVDAYDGEISLREAVEIYAGSFYYREVALPEGATFESGGVTYTVKGGKFYVDNTTDYRVYPGESFSFTEAVAETIVWDGAQSAYVDAEGNVVALTNGDKATFTVDGVEYVDAQWDEAASVWSGADFSFAAADVAEATLNREAVVTVVYAEDVYFDADNKAIAVPNGTKGEIDGVAVEMIDGVWTSVAQTSYNRDQVQAMGNFFLADGTEVAVVNGVFRRVATDSVAVVLDGSVVTLANGESAVYDAAKGVFVVTTTVEYPMTEGAKVVVDGVELTFVESAYVDSGDYRYYLTDGVVVTLSNGYEVEYNARRDAFVFKSENVAGKIDAGSTILWEGETYSYKAGVAIVQKVSREANAVVFDAALDGQTFVLTQGELTLSKSFTLDCVDPNGQHLDLTIQGVNSRLFTVETGASVEIKNFKLANSTSSQDGGVVYNKGTLTIDSVAFSGNESNGGVGGSIYNASGATLTVSNSTFSGDSARDGASIYNAGSATIQDSTFDANGEFGNGVLYNVGTLVVDNTQFNGGSTASSGGALYNAGTADVSNSTFDGTAALNGGAIYNAANGTLRLADSDFANVSATVGGAIYNVGNATIDQGAFVGNSTTDKGGAIYNEGTATVVGTLFAGNFASVGGAFYSTGTLKLTGVKVERSEARDGAAIYSTGTLSVANSLIVKNVATGLGGAIYNAGTATLTNATIADNQAADGAGLYNAGTATVDNTILAGNKATDAAAKGFDLYTVEGATTTLRSSLLGNVAQYGDKAFGLDAAYRSFLGVDPQFVDAANGDYTLSATSPAINGGSNALDGGALVDFAGNDRRVGLTVGGVVMSVDMGAFEYTAIIAPDLDLVDSSVDYWQTEKLENGAAVELDYFVAGQDVCVDFNVQNIGDAAVYTNFGYTMTLVGTNDKGEVVYTKTQDIRYYASSFDRFDWLNENDWIAADGSASLAANLGALPAGRYTVTLTLDVDGVGKVVEYGEEDGFLGENNNVYAGTFNVFEAPSAVVTTEQDVVDPTDGLTSIREAIAHAGAYEYVSIFMVADGTQYVLEDGQIVTVENGSLTVKVDVVEKNGVLVDLQDGDEFLLNGRPIYYRAQLNGGYFAYSMEEGAERADVSSGEVTFPDGAAANLQLNTDQYVSFVDGTNLNPSEGDRYSYQTLVFPNGEKVILTDGAALEYANVKFTYRQNDEYPDGAFVFENGSVVAYADGGSLEFANLAVGTLQTRNEIYRDELILVDGSKIQVIDGVARLTKSVDPIVTFAESMQGKTITVDAATGPIEIADGVVIDGEDRDVTLDGANSTGIFLVQEGAVATISRLTATRGAGAVGGAVVNRGSLTLNDVDFANNNVRLVGTPTDGELTSGLGGAIYNVGTLSVNGGTFENNLASEFGGAIFSKGELVVKNASFVGGSAFAGGAIAAQAGTLAVENSTFTNNVAEVGGAVYTLVDATFVAVSFVGNDATNGNGGAIYAGPKATITFAADAASESTLAVSFEGNKASGNGGALYTENVVVVAGDLVAKDAETTDGAALYIGGGLTVDGSATITGNKSATSALIAKIVEIKGDLTLEANESANAALESAGAVAVGGSATISGAKTGGAIAAQGAVSFGGDLTAKNNVATDGAIIAGTSFNVGGAAIFENNESTTGAVLVGGAVEIAGALTATGNKATAGSIISGSTIIVGADATLANNESTTGSLTANEAVEFGGTLTATGNKATDGAIISGATVNVVGDATLTSNESTTGAVVALGDVEIDGALTAENNKATASGAVVAAVGSLTVGGDATLIGNEAGASGGAVAANGAVAFGGSLTATNNKAVGSGGAILAGAGVSVVGDATLTGNTAGGVGGAIAAQTVAIDGSLTAADNSAASGGAIYATGAVEIDGSLTATNNAATALAGGVIATSAGVSVGGDATLTGNSAQGSGGAIAATQNVVITGAVKLENNSAALAGGAIAADGSVEVGGDATFANNAAGASGGAVVALGSVSLGGSATLTGNEAGAAGGAISTNGSLEIVGALTASDNTSGGFGGAIAVGGDVTVGADATMTDNEATFSGGAIYAKDSAVEITGVLTAENNKAGAQTVEISSTVETTTLEDGTVVETTVKKFANDGFGGAIAAPNGDVTVGGDATLTGNSSAGYGGAVYAGGAVSFGGSATLKDNEAKDATATTETTVVTTPVEGDATTETTSETLIATVGHGGAIAANGAFDVVGALTAENNKAAGYGGAVFANDAITVGGDAILTGNEAGKDGGALISKTEGVAIGGALTATNNKSTENGGAIYANGALTVVGDATLTGNEGANGGAILSRADVQIDGALIAENNKATGSGGAISAVGSLTVGGDATLTGNEAAQIGGALAANGAISLGGSLTATNNAATVGGAILSGAGVSVEGDATLTGNAAAGAGGAIASTQNVEIGGALTANDNKAANGGAISANGSVAIVGALTATNNEATGTAGGVIVSGASVSVGGDATLSGNKAAGSGGAIAALENVVIVGAAKAENNAAGLSGGAIAADGSVEIGGDATFANNAAQAAGGAVVALGDVAFGGSATLTGNSAGEAGGAISANGSLEIVGALTASDNTSGGFGGAVAVGGAVELGGDATLTGNESKFSGGAIYAKDGDVAIVGALTASDNKAGAQALEIETTETETLEDGTTVVTTVKTTITDGAGGAIAAPKGDVTVGGDATLTGNSSNGRGGAIYAENATFAGNATFENNAANAGSVVVETTVVTTPVEGDATTETTVDETVLLGSGGAVYAGAVEIGGALTAKDNDATDAGGAIYASSLDVVGSATLTGNAASNGGAVYSTGSVAIGATLTATGNVAYEGGAFNVETLSVEGLAKLTDNKAVDGSGGAIYASTVELKDGALLTDNVAAEAGGAIYALELTLVSATVAGNEAANGGGLYVVDSATLDNTIVAGNKATAYEETYETTDENGEVVEATRTVGGEGADIYVSNEGTATLRNSLLQNTEIGAGELVLVEEYRSILGVDPQFNDDYSLKATSPAINAGSNALAGASDVDLAGASRYVGLTVDGEVYAIDMGAFEYQTVAAPNLTFAENPVNFWYATVDGEKKDYYIFGEDVVLDFSFLNAASTLAEVGSGMVIDKFSVSFVVEGVAANGDTVSQTFEYRYQPESDYFDWLSTGDWLDADELVSYARQNLGVLPVGNYSLSISLDVNDEIVERGEEDGSEAANDNVYTTAFEVREAPSTVVTTDKDVVDPTDDLISLREAVEVYAGSYWYSSTIMIGDGAEYVLDDLTHVVVKDGNATVSRDVATLVESQTTLRDGDKFAFGTSAMTFENGVVTYPDGTTATYDGENALTFEAADGTIYVVKPESYYDYIQNTQQPVADPNVATVDVIIMPNGDMIALEHLEQTEFYYGETFATYNELVAVDAEGNAISFANGAALVLDGKAGVYQNGAVRFEDGSFARLTDGAAIEIDGVAATFVGAAFVLPNGEVVEFVAGETLVCENGSTVAMTQVDEIISGVLDLENGRRVEFLGDGSANVSTQVGTDVTFAANLDKATIKLESAITVDRDLTIDASDRTNVSVSGANQTNVFVIAEGATATMTSLSIKNAVAQIGAGVANYGTLSLVDVSISGTKATSEADEPFADKILTEGVGAAIYNAGTLSVDGGSFANNVSTFHGGAIYSVGSLAVKNATFEGNVSEYYGGAIYVQDGTATVDSSVFKGNKAQYGGAVATNVSLKAANSIFTENIGTLGGALYAWGPNASIEATQSTLIANVAEQGGAIYVADAALTLKNSIVATNEATEGATDLALVGSATATVYASLIGVADDCGDGTLNFDAGTRSFYGTTENPVDPALDAEGRPTAVSPALNSGSNALATATDGSALTADASGADRIVGVDKDGTIYSVDMGALEFQTVAAPDLGFFKEDGSFLYGQEKPVAGFTLSLSGFGGEGFSNTGDFVEGWDVSFAVGYGNAGNAYCFESFAVELKTVRLDADGNAIEGTETVLTRVFGDESSAFDVEDWLASGEAFVELWNLGAAYEAGQYKLTLTVDAADSVVELDETNNVFETNFAVRERPSLVVTTEQDVVNPYDGETSLREAIALVGADGSVGMRLNEVLTEGETFVLAENAALGIPADAVATYADGKITFVVDVLDEEGNPVVDESGVVQTQTIELAQNVEVALADGTTFAWQERLGCAVATRGDAIGSAITFAESVYGKTIELTSELTIDRSMTIDGTGANVVVSGANASRIATVARGTVSVFGLTFENGSANLGGAIYNAANLTLTNVSVKNSSATEDGGAIYNALGGELTLTNVEILGAAATNGGAIYNAGALFGEEVAISGSNAAYGAGLYNVGEALFAGVSFADGVATAQGGAIYNDGGELVVDDASFVANQANYGGAIVNYQGVATIVGANFTANKATSSAGAIDNYGELTLNGVTFENNEAAVAGGAIYNSESASTSDAYSVALSDVVFDGNSATTGGAIYNAKGSVVEATGAVSFSANSAATEGGAIYNAGTATFATDATFSANSAASGGAIFNAGTATLTGAKFDGNVATKDGGAVANAGAFYATTSEFVANEANGLGGAIYNLAGKASLANALVSQNVASEGGAIANAKGANLELRNATIAANVATTAGGVYDLGTLNAQNSIIAANSATTAVDLYSNGSAKLLNSLVGSTEGIGTKPSATNSLLDVDPGFAVAPVFNGDGTLANGAALDLRLVYDSVAVDAGNNAYAKDASGQTTLTTDLDGGARVATKVANVDMGAYEFQFEEPSTVVTTDLDVVDVTDGKISLREAIEYAAQLGESTVEFAEGLATIYLNSTLELDASITLDASAVGGVTLDACRFVDAASAIAIDEGAKVSLVSLTITNSSANAQDWLREDNDRPQYSGGAVWNAGEVILRDATISGNVAAYGGGLYNLGVMRVYNSTVENNVALYYGGVYNRGELYVENSTIAGNKATYSGGGVSNFAEATLVGTAIVGNRAETGAGVLALANVSGSRIAPETTLTNCTVAGNVATSAGGGVWANDVLNVVNTIVAGNVANTAADLYLAGSADADVRYSLVGASNAKISGVGVKTDVDPNFVDFAAPTAGSWTANAWKAWNLELTVGSPAIDAGAENLAVDANGVKLTTDLAGDKRVAGKAIDMGAYEEQGNVAPTGIVVEINGELTTETLVAGTVVATLTTEDANGDEDVYEYELLGASDYFALDGDKIVATQDVPAGSYEIVVRSTDQGGKSVETTVQIVVVNPGAENYAAPTITSVANNSESALEVFWTTGDPAKEYVVSYRVGDGAWIETNALTGEHGTIEGDFNVGDVVQVRIRAVGGVDKNGSDWSEAETYVVAEPPKAFDVATTGSGALVSLTVDSNFGAVAYWRVVWGDGTETVVNELSTQRVFGHVYAATGDYEMKLFVNNDEVGYELGVFEASVASNAVLETLTAETTNVFSNVAPVAVETAATQAEEIAVSVALLADETIAWNEIAESLAVESTVETGVALVAAPTTRVERAVVFEALGAAFAEMGADEFETVDVDFAVEDAANETAFDDAFLSELFGD